MSTTTPVLPAKSIVVDFKHTYAVPDLTCYLKSGDKYAGVFAICSLDITDMQKMQNIRVPDDLIVEFHKELALAGYAFKLNMNFQDQAFRITVTGLAGSKNPAVTVTAEARYYDVVYPVIMYKLAGLGYPQAYTQSNPRETLDGIR